MSFRRLARPSLRVGESGGDARPPTRTTLPLSSSSLPPPVLSPRGPQPFRILWAQNNSKARIRTRPFLLLVLPMVTILSILWCTATTLMWMHTWDEPFRWSSSSNERQLEYFAADPDRPTIAIDSLFKKKEGFFNQQMAFARIVMRIVDMRRSNNNRTNGSISGNDQDYYQVLLPSLAFTDYLGSGKKTPFERLFDVSHWNSIAGLPKLVSYNATQHYQYSITKQAFIQKDHSTAPYTHPYRLDNTRQAFQEYVQIMNTVNKVTQLHPADRLMLQGALRPHPTVQRFIDQIIARRGTQGSNDAQDDPAAANQSSTRYEYMALHARVEQDFICHPFPTPVEHRNLTQLLELLERTWPEPPASRCFIAINRPLLESPDKLPDHAKPSKRACEAERAANLEALNRARRYGLWGGRVQVLERPPLLQQHHSQFADRPVVFASLMDAELCRQAKMFVGSLRSTFTLNIIRRRSVGGNLENYRYDAEKLTQVNGAGYPKA